MHDILNQLGQAIATCRQAPDAATAVWVRPYIPPEDTRLNHFLIMLKPELTIPAADAPPFAALGRVLALLADHGVELGAMRVVSAGYLATHHIIEQHYEMLYQISTQGFAAVSEVARARLQSHYPHVFADEVPRILGGHQFLARFPDFTPFALDVLTRNLTVVKLGAGTYAIDVALDGERWCILNAFHPAQLAHFTTPGRVVVLIEGRDRRHLSTIRRQTIGATDPREAAVGSIKHHLLTNQHELGLRGISTRLNGIHMSPSPVEAMFALQRYFGEGPARLALGQTALGAHLLAAGIPEATLQRLECNPEIELPGSSGPLFEVTEDRNWDEAATLVETLIAEPQA